MVIGSDAMIPFEDSDDSKPLKLYSKKYDLRNNGVPEKIDGPVEIIEYKKKMPLTEQLNYFVNNLDKQINISNGKHAINVTRILVNASNKLQQSINGWLSRNKLYKKILLMK